MFAEFDQENPINPTLIMMCNCVRTYNNCFVRVYTALRGILHSDRRESWHLVKRVRYIEHVSSSMFPLFITRRLGVRTNYAKRVMSTWTAKSNQNITLYRLLACLRVHKYLSMPCLLTSLYGKSGMLVKAFCDYTSMISHKTIAIFYNMLVNF